MANPGNASVKRLLSPEHVPAHFGLYFFFALSIMAGLWRHGHPWFTVILIGSLLPLSLIPYISMKILNESCRDLLQAMTVGAALAWGVYRFVKHVPPDKFLVEAVTITGLCFAFSARAKEYGYQSLIAVVLLLYGALFPREIYIYLLPLIFLSGLFFLYQTRSIAFAGDSDVGIPQRLFRRNWHFQLLHLFLSLSFAVYLYSVFPSPDKPGVGFITASFMNNNDDYMAPDINRWFKSKHVKKSLKGMIMTGKDASFYGKKGPFITSKSKQPTTSASGSGAGTPGKDLIFRVKSPVKLYWLSQLYDRYDGEIWKSTKKMQRQKMKFHMGLFGKSRSLRQNVVIEKWHSPVLPSAFMANHYSCPTLRKKTTGAFYNKRLKPKMPYPPLPFNYSVTSYIFEPSKGVKVKGKKMPYWLERIPPKHYLQLPKKKISPRLKELAKEVVGNRRSPYNKALKIRDYLRSNFTYEMHSEPVPKGRESVDFFLFDLKKGNCQYFASSMTVLARLNGLPARLTTGFSPGNFNVLNGWFEVREYHAHAWAQVFIEGMGWLTFDGTPPGSITSRTLPIGLGSFHDPFGDEWRITPPELAENTQNTLRPSKPKPMMITSKKQIKPSTSQTLAKLIMKIPTSKSELNDSLAELNSFKEKVISPEKNEGFKNYIHTVKTNFKTMLNQIWTSWQNFVKWLASTNGLLILLLIGILPVLRYLLIIFMRRVKRDRLLRKCRELYSLAKDKVVPAPGECIDLSYRLVRELLNLSGHEREKNMDLFDYGSTLNSIDKDLCKNALVVFFIYSQYEYSTENPSTKESALVFERTKRVVSSLLEDKKA